MPHTPPTLAPYRPGPHRVALFAAILTWPLLLVGGSVTVFRVGMAVPDWPTTFGINMFLYNFWNTTWGVFIEHGHRLYGALLGFACVVLAVWFAVAERRPWMKGLGSLALVAVITQGFLGGYRVRLNSPNLAFLHGCSAQAFFGLMIALCVLTGRDSVRSIEKHADRDQLRRRSLVTLAMIYAQTVLGAQLRHFGSGLILHAAMAAAVWGHAVFLCWRVERHRQDLPDLIPAARVMAVTVSLQIILGIAAWVLLRPFDGIAREVTIAQALIRLGHQGAGALLLASSVVMTLRAFVRLRSSQTVENRASRTRELEAVA